MKVYFMRHGESEYNVAQRINFEPNKEVHLTLNWQDQIKEAADHLSNVRFDSIYSSPFIRAKESAAIIAKGRRIKIKPDKRLGEFRFGFEGESVEEYYNLRETAENLTEFKLKGFESFLDVKKRVHDFLIDLKKKKHGRVLIVAHEAIVQAARTIFNELSDEDAFATPIKNAQYFMFDM